MKERPFLLYQHEVPGIIDGRQTQLRRVVKQPIEGRRFGDRVWPAFTKPHVIDGFEAIGVDAVNNGGLGLIRKPFCAPGDRLWGRETWSPDHKAFYPNFPVVYQADAYDPRTTDRNGKYISQAFSPEANCSFPFKWRSSIHMPRWASRITLEVTDVRVERLNEMDRAAAFLEGCPKEVAGPDGDIEAAHIWFRRLWESINGKGSWDANPWVWAVTFKPITNG